MSTMTAPSTLSLLVLALCLATGLCTDSPKADDGYMTFPAYNASRYKIPPLELHWIDALAVCEAEGEGATLAVLNSVQESEVIATWLSGLEGDGSRLMWMGISIHTLNGPWFTVQGVLLSESGFDQWGVNYPYGMPTWSCGWTQTTGLYYNDLCTYLKPFICEKPNV